MAWANSPNTYAAYSEDTTAMANYYLGHPFAGSRYAIGSGYGLMPLQYLAHNHVTYTQIDPGTISKTVFPVRGAKEFSVGEGDKAAAIKALEAKFPKGKTSPHYSSFSGNELFVVYTVPAS